MGLGLGLGPVPFAFVQNHELVLVAGSPLWPVAERALSGKPVSAANLWKPVTSTNLPFAMLYRA